MEVEQMQIEKPVENEVEVDEKEETAEPPTKKICLISELEKKIQDVRTPGAIVVYNNRIYITERVYSLIYLKDYYSTKRLMIKTSMDFTIDLDERSLQNSNHSWNTQEKTERFTNFFNKVKIIQENEVDTVFQECLQTIYNENAVQHVSLEAIKINEMHHRARLVERIYGHLNGITDALYEVSKKCGNTIIVAFHNINMNSITNYGKHPIYSVCADGKKRSEKEYVYYLLESVFKKDVSVNDIDDYHWFVIEMFKIIRTAFPGFKLDYEDTTSFLPKIIITSTIKLIEDGGLN